MDGVIDRVMDGVVDISGWLADVAASEYMNFWLLIQVVMLAMLIAFALWVRRRGQR